MIDAPSPAPTTAPLRRLVIGATLHAELAESVRRARPHLEIRGNRYTDITAADLAWGEAYLGFKRPPLPSMGAIRWVHCTGAGVDGWLFPDPLPAGVLLTRTSESFGPMIAEWALARALAFSQQLLDLADCQRERRWAPRDVAMLRGSRTLVVGTGDVGGQVGRLFAALGSEVHGVSRTGRGDPGVFATTEGTAALSDRAAAADWIVVTLPLTNATRGLIGHDVLTRCRGAVLLNAGRGAVVDEGALLEALDEGWLRGAALDVFETEPLPAASPLWGHSRVVISPHISGLTTIDGAVRGFLETLGELERGERPSREVDRQRQY